MFHLDGAISETVDGYVIPHITSYWKIHANNGSGKSTWPSRLVDVLHDSYHYNTIAVSLDDFYQDHTHLVALVSHNPTNALLQTRGQPGIHDEILATQFFRSLQYQRSQEGADYENGEEKICIPSFDKSEFGGEGDRVPKEKWQCISKRPKIEIVVSDGWCIGFRPLLTQKIHEKWGLAKDQASLSLLGTSEYAVGKSIVTLQDHLPEHLETVNENLRRYCSSFSPQHFDYLIHLDTNDLSNVYEWRLQQEHALCMKGKGAMRDEAAKDFVKGYMPAYELYLENLRVSFFRNENEWQDRMNGFSKGHAGIILD